MTAMVGLFVFVVAMTVAATFTASALRAVRFGARRLCALYAAQGILEEIRAERPPWLRHRGERGISSPFLRTLPGGRAKVRVGREPAKGVREVCVIVNWREPGGPERRLEIYTLMRVGP